MTDNNEKPNQNISSPDDEPKYLKALNSKPSNRKVGQVFIRTVNMQQHNETTPEEKISPLQEKTIWDIMKE